MQCSIAYGNIPIWNNTHQAPMPRLPLYELNYTSIPGMFFLNPMQSLILGPVEPNRTLPHIIDHISDMWQEPSLPIDNITVCFLPGQSPVPGRRCVSRTANPQLKLGPDGRPVVSATAPIGCLERQGWLFPLLWPSPFVVPLACPGYPNATAVDVQFDKPEHLSMWWPSSSTNPARNYSLNRVASTAKSVAVYTDVTAAADSVWAMLQQGFSVCFWMHNITTRSDLSRVKALYGADWSPAWNTAYNKRNLVEMDLTFSEGLNPVDTDRWSVASHILFEYIPLGDNVTLRAVAVRLSNVPGKPGQSQVYTPGKSRSAFILAMMLARSSVALSVLNAGHIFTEHVMFGAASYSLYNAIDPGVPEKQSRHPVRILSDWFFSPRYAAEFQSLLIGNILSSPAANLVYESNQMLLPFLERYAKAGPVPDADSFYGSSIPQLLAKTGLHVDRFTSPGSKVAWDLFPQAAVYLGEIAVVSKFVTEYVNLFYPTDAAVAGDEAIQTFGATMLDPYGGNLKKINARNNLNTRQSLADVLTQMMYLTTLHINSHYIDFTADRFNSGLVPFAPSIRDFPVPNGRYTTADIVRAGPSSVGLSKQAAVGSFLDLVTPLTPQWVPNKCEAGEECPPPFTFGAIPDYEADLPYNSSTPLGKAANDLFVQFRKDLPEYKATTPFTKVLHQLNTGDLFASMMQTFLTL